MKKLSKLVLNKEQVRLTDIILKPQMHHILGGAYGGGYGFHCLNCWCKSNGASIQFCDEGDKQSLEATFGELNGCPNNAYCQ